MRIITDAGEMYDDCIERAADHYGFRLTDFDPLLMKTYTKNVFHIFVPIDLDR